MTTEMILVATGFVLQAMSMMIGALIWHEFKRLQNKVDSLTTHRMDCMNLFASKESQQRFWNKLDEHERRICRLEGKNDAQE